MHACNAAHKRDAYRSRYSGAMIVNVRPDIYDRYSSLLSKDCFLWCDKRYLRADKHIL